jgi:hypothetical protein
MAGLLKYRDEAPDPFEPGHLPFLVRHLDGPGLGAERDDLRGHAESPRGTGLRRGGLFAGGLCGNTGGLAGGGSPAARNGRVTPPPAPAVPSHQLIHRGSARLVYPTARPPTLPSVQLFERSTSDRLIRENPPNPTTCGLSMHQRASSSRYNPASRITTAAARRHSRLARLTGVASIRTVPRLMPNIAGRPSGSANVTR